MSSLLEQAIIDAKMLKETARKNAEAAILEQYAEEIKQNMDMLLEQDESDPLAGILDTVSAAAAPAAEPTPAVKRVMNQVPPSYLNESDGEIELNLESLVQKVSALQEELEEAHQPSRIETSNEVGFTQEESLEEVEELDEVRPLPADATPGDAAIEQAKLKKAQAIQTNPGIKLEELTIDISRGPKEIEGGIGSHKTMNAASATQAAVKHALSQGGQISSTMTGYGFPEKTAPHEEEEGVEHEELEVEEEAVDSSYHAGLEEALVEKAAEYESLEEEFNAAMAQLREAKQKIKETREKLNTSLQLNTQLKEGVEYLSEKIKETNLVNARLLYTNKALGNNSLNERQKSQIAEAVSKAKSVEEAKVLFETLQRTAGAVQERKAAPQSLTEALQKAPSPFLPRAVQPTRDPYIDRMKLLAGIKK
jgi:hypothetical protein